MTFDGIFLARPTLKLPKKTKKLVKSHSYFGLHNNANFYTLILCFSKSIFTELLYSIRTINFYG